MKIYIITAPLLMLIPGCASFIQDENKPGVFQLEEQTFRPKIVRDLTDEGYPFQDLDFPQDRDIRLVVVFGTDWVKVYGYPDTGKNAKLNEERYLILYMFEEDFPGKRFDPELFKRRLFSVMELSEQTVRQ